MMRRKSASGELSAGQMPPMPALLNTPSSRPKVDTVVATIASTCSVNVTSTGTKTQRPRVERVQPRRLGRARRTGEVGQGHPGAFAQAALHRGQPDAAGTTGDEDDVVLQSNGSPFEP